MDKQILSILEINPEHYSFLDSKNILYKIINGTTIGKRCIDTLSNGVKWKEDFLPEDKVYKYLHPENADYEEIFYPEIY